MKHYLVSDELMKAAVQSLGTQPYNQVRTIVNVLESCQTVEVERKAPEQEKDKQKDEQ